MAFLSVDSTNSLVVYDAYDHRAVIGDLGGYWDANKKAWVIVFTIANLEGLLDAIPDISVSEDLSDKVKEQMEKEAKLEKLRAMSKQDVPVSLRIPGMKLPLYNYQRLGVMYAATNRVGLLLADEMGLGKAEVVDNQVFTTTGRRRIGSLKIGDNVIGKDGKPHCVVGVYPQGMQDIYRVWFNDGFYLDVGPEHLWEVRSNNQHNKKRTSKGVVLSMSQLLDKNGVSNRVGEGHNSDKVYEFKTYYKKSNGNNSWGIPMVDAIDFEKKEVLIDSYLLGVWLGDGHICKNGYVMLRMLKTDLEDMSIGGKTLSSKRPHMKSVSFDMYKKELICLGLNGKRSWEKFIPDEYKYNSLDIRLGVIQGLMDTDGHAADCATEYSTSSKRLCDDVVEIVQTLGGIARVRTKIPTYWYKGKKKKGRTSYRVNIKLSPSIVPFRLSRKIADYDMCRKYVPERYICNIEKLAEKKETICISVDAPDNLYVTEHCIVTHNTLQAIGTSLFLKAYAGATKALIVTPASLKFNWPLEIEKFTDEKYVVIDGTPEERVAQWLREDVFFYVVNFELLLEDLFGGRKFREKKGESDEDKEKRLARHEKISVKAKQRRGILDGVRNRVWDVLAVDEAQAIRHHSSSRTRNLKDLNAKCRMALTGTPMDGRLEELHSLMQFVAPGLLMSKTRFFQRYVETDFWGRVTGYKNIGEVSQKIQPFFLRRLKKDVLKDLPDKVYQNRIVSMDASEHKTYKSIAEQGHEATEDALAVVALIRCKQFCNLPKMVDPSCATSSKMDAFKEVVDEVVLQNGHKALIFSQYKEMLDVIVSELEKMGIKYLRIDGDTPTIQRASMQKQFNDDKAIDVMVGTEAMSTGLNFQSADYVINYDDNWSPSIMAQREDRAHRNGQRNVVTVVNFICQDTIEERIRGVIYAKNRMSSQVLGDETEEYILKRLGPKDLAKLL